MNLEPPTTTSTENSTSVRSRADHSAAASKRMSSRSIFDESDNTSDGQRFEQLIEDLKQDDLQSEKHDGNSAISDDGSSRAIEDSEVLSGLGENLDQEVQSGEHQSASRDAPETSMMLEYSSYSTSVDSQVSMHASTASTSTSALNEAAARIIQEMQSRARHNESRRWQFTLSGFSGGSMTITIERAMDQSWIVELSTSDGSTDEERFALEQKLGETLASVRVVDVAS